MASRLGSLVYALTADDRSFNRSMRRSSKVIDEQERKWRKLQRTVRSVGRSIATPIAAYASIQGLRALGDAIGNVTERGATLVETATRVGFATERLQLLGRVVEGEGGNFDKLITGLDRFSRSVAEAAEGATEYKDAFDRIGVTVTDSFGRGAEYRAGIRRGRRGPVESGIAGSAGTDCLRLVWQGQSCAGKCIAERRGRAARAGRRISIPRRGDGRGERSSEGAGSEAEESWGSDRHSSIADGR